MGGGLGGTDIQAQYAGGESAALGDETILRVDRRPKGGIERLLPGNTGDFGRLASDNRAVVTACLWVLKTGVS